MLTPMKKWKIIAGALLIFIFCIPVFCSAQMSFRSADIKYVDNARRKAVTGTLFPLAIGIGATYIFDNNIVETTGSWLAVYGLIMGPSAGNFYAKDYWRGFLGVAARLGGGFLIHNATRELVGRDMADVLGWDDKKVSLTGTRILIGGALILGSTLYNIISTKASVEQYNERSDYVMKITPVIREGKIMPFITARINF